MVNKSRLLRPTGIFFSFLFFFVVVLLFLDLVKRVQPPLPDSQIQLPPATKGITNFRLFLLIMLIDESWRLSSVRLLIRDAILITAYQYWNTVSLHFIHIIWQIFLLKTILTYKNSAKVHLGSDMCLQNVFVRVLLACIFLLSSVSICLRVLSMGGFPIRFTHRIGVILDQILHCCST